MYFDGAKGKSRVMSFELFRLSVDRVLVRRRKGRMCRFAWRKSVKRIRYLPSCTLTPRQNALNSERLNLTGQVLT